MEKGVFIRDFKPQFVEYFTSNFEHKYALSKNILLAYVKDLSMESRLQLRTRMNKYHDADLVIVSPSIEASILAWKISAQQFVLDNDLSQSQILKDVKSAFDKLHLTKANQINKISFNTLEGIQSYDLNEILFIKADGSYSNIFTDKKNIMVSKKLKSFEEKLCGRPQFYRFNRSYIFNLNKITQINGHEVIFEGEHKIQFSKYSKGLSTLKNILLWENI